MFHAPIFSVLGLYKLLSALLLPIMIEMIADAVSAYTRSHYRDRAGMFPNKISNRRLSSVGQVEVIGMHSPGPFHAGIHRSEC